MLLSKRLLWFLLGQQNEEEPLHLMGCHCLMVVSEAAPQPCQEAIQTSKGSAVIFLPLQVLVDTGMGGIDRFLKIRILGWITTMIRENYIVPATLMSTDWLGLVTLINKDQSAQEIMVQ